MKRRFTRLPIASIALVVGCLLVGLSMSPVGAQSGLTNGQVTVRSDGAVYLISNGMRRWVATVVITDDELNAYPEAEPIYAGLAPFGSASAGTATKTTTGTAAAKTGTAPSTTTTASKTSTPTTKNQTTGQVITDPASGADAKDPNDLTLADAPPDVDPTGQAKPTGATTCPDSHKVKGGFDKKYYDIDRPNYLTVEVEACFRTGKDARDAKYTEAKKQ